MAKQYKCDCNRRLFDYEEDKILIKCGKCGELKEVTFEELRKEFRGENPFGTVKVPYP